MLLKAGIVTICVCLCSIVLNKKTQESLRNYFYSQIQPQLSTTTQLHHRHHVGNLENKKKSSTTRLLLGIDLEHVMN